MNDFSTTAFLTKTESEKIVLGAFFLESELIKDCVLTPNSFGVRKHQELFAVLKALDEKGLPIEPIAVIEHVGLENDGRIGGLSYVMELVNGAFSTASFAYHQELILEYHKRRKMFDIAQQITQSVLEKNSDELMQDMMQNMALLEENDTDDDDGHISKVLAETHEWMETNHGTTTGAPTGFRELDNMTNGLQKQDLVIIGGRPSMGKTAFAVNACLNFALDRPKERPNGGPVALFSLEMSNRILALRMLSNFGNIDGHNMRNPFIKFSSSDWQQSTRAFGQLGKLPVHMFDKTGINIAYIRRKLRMMKRKYPGQHIVAMIDYLQLIQGDPKHKGNRTQEISDLSRSLKSIARELDLTIIALSQLSRDVERRQDKRPMIADLRESGQIEQDADVIAFLYRDDYYDKESEHQGIVEVIVAKQRNGPTGVVSLAYLKEFSKFVNIAKPTGE